MSEHSLVRYALRARTDNPGAAARMRFGLDPLTEARAYSDVLPFGDNKALLRTAALICLHPSIPQVEGVSLGVSFRKISNAKFGDLDPDRPNTIATRLLQMADQDLDEASSSINRILSMADNLNIGVNYYRLGDTLLHWGNGISEESQHVRRRLLRDFYQQQKEQA